MTRRPFRRVIAPGLIPGRKSDDETDEEIEAHLELRAQDLMASGMRADEARAEALRRFGDLARSRRALHAGARRRDSARRHRDRIGALAADLRFAWRQARRAPVFHAIAIATLAIGIGLTTAMFALVDHVLLRPLPFGEPERLVSLSSVDSLGGDFPQVSSSNWQDWRAGNGALVATAIHLEREVDLRAEDGAIRVAGQLVSGAFFEVVQPRFVAGRPFSNLEVQAGATDVVISEQLWRSMFGADPELRAPLRTLTGDRRITGVVAAGHDYPPGTDVWHPGIIAPARTGTRNNVNWQAIARLRPGVTIPQAEADLGAIATRIRESDPSALYSHGVKVRRLSEQIVGNAEDYLILLVGAVAFVLLIACANVAAANLARGTLRSREMAVRAAIGAGRGRLVQQLLVEHGMLAAFAGALGVVLAWSVLHVAVAAWGAQVPRATGVALDAPVLMVAAGVTVLGSVLSGLIPALIASRLSLSALLASGARGTTRSGRAFAGRALVAGQIAIAVVLVCGSLLTIRSFRALISRDLGFELNVAMVEAALVAPGLRDEPERQYAYWETLRRSLSAIPGVTHVGLANWTPMGGGGTSFIDIEERDRPNSGAGFRVASEGYLEAIGVPLLVGRLLSVDDDASSPRVAVVNRTMAQRYWPDGSPMGKRVRATSMEDFGAGPAPWRTVVGVVGDVRHHGFESDAGPEMYVPFRQVAPYWIVGMTAAVQARLPIERLIPVIRVHARRANPNVAVEVTSLERLVSERIAPQRMMMSLLGLFGTVSLLLAALGTYGLLSYVVANRAREMAVRAALGATRARLVGLVFCSAATLIGAGLVVGLVGAAAVSRVLETQLVQISRTDPVAFGGAVAVIAATAVLATLLPALRASAAKPAEALRAD